ncbi:MAG: PilN domain-containing protein [Cyanobacteria bacterium J06641_5]
MYSLDINFLKERAAEGQPQAAAAEQQSAPGGTPADWLPAIGGAALGAVLVAGVLIYGRLVDGQISTLETEVATLQSELGNLQASQQEIDRKRQELSEQQSLTRSLVDVFDRIKPMTAILQDVSDRLPIGVQLESFEQTGERPDIQVQFQGLASSYRAISSFALAVEQSKFVREGTIQLGDVAETEYPLNNAENLPEGLGPVPVFSYTLTATLNDTSAADLLDELQRKGADGLAARIDALKSQGLVSGAADPNGVSEGLEGGGPAEASGFIEGDEPAEATEPQ